MELIEDVIERLGDEATGVLMDPIWTRPILKRDAQGIHGTLFYEHTDKRQYIPSSKREVDTNPLSVNWAQRELFDRGR